MIRPSHHPSAVAYDSSFSPLTPLFPPAIGVLSLSTSSMLILVALPSSLRALFLLSLADSLFAGGTCLLLSTLTLFSHRAFSFPLRIVARVHHGFFRLTSLHSTLRLSPYASFLCISPSLPPSWFSRFLGRSVVLRWPMLLLAAPWPLHYAFLSTTLSSFIFFTLHSQPALSSLPFLSSFLSCRLLSPSHHCLGPYAAFGLSLSLACCFLSALLLPPSRSLPPPRP